MGPTLSDRSQRFLLAPIGRDAANRLWGMVEARIVVRRAMTIGNRAVVGTGSVMTRAVAIGVAVKGNPAR